MRLPFAAPAAPPRSRVGFTIRGTLTLYGRSLVQVQYVTEHYVVTRVEPGMFIFLPDRGERFLVDRGAGKLRRLEPATQRVRADRLRAVVGEIQVEREDAEVDAAGFRCRRYRFENMNARLVIAGETLVTKIDGIEETALHAEREHDALHQPFSLPLESNDLVVESKLRTLTAEFEQNQAYRLEGVTAGVDDLGELDRLARMAVID